MEEQGGGGCFIYLALMREEESDTGGEGGEAKDFMRTSERLHQLMGNGPPGTTSHALVDWTGRPSKVILRRALLPPNPSSSLLFLSLHLVFLIIFLL